VRRIPVAGQRTQETTFWALGVTSQVATSGSESVVSNCVVGLTGEGLMCVQETTQYGSWLHKLIGGVSFGASGATVLQKFWGVLMV